MKQEMCLAGDGMVAYENIYIPTPKRLHTHKFCHQNGEEVKIESICRLSSLLEIYAQA